MEERDHYITQSELLHSCFYSPPLMIPPPSPTIDVSSAELSAHISSFPISKVSETSTVVKSTISTIGIDEAAREPICFIWYHSSFWSTHSELLHPSWHYLLLLLLFIVVSFHPCLFAYMCSFAHLGHSPLCSHWRLLTLSLDQDSSSRAPWWATLVPSLLPFYSTWVAGIQPCPPTS